MLGDLFKHQAARAKRLPQQLVLGATYVAIDGCFLCCYGRFAEWFGRKLWARPRGTRIRVDLTG